MKRRVAYWVTCVCLICCIAFAVLNTHTSLNRLTNSATDDLLRICRMSAEFLDNAAFSSSEDTDALKELAGEIGVGMTVLASDGTVKMDTQTTASVNAIDDEEVELALKSREGVGLSVREGIVYAACELEDGGVVRVWRAAPSWLDAMDVIDFRMVLVVVLLIIICYVMVQVVVAPAEQLVRSVKSVLDAFAEGKFEERVAYKGAKGYSHYADEINDAAARIEEWLTRQNRRAQAMSAVLNQSQNGMLAVDSSFRIILATASAKQLLNLKGNCDGVLLNVASKDDDVFSVFEEAMKQDGVYTNEVAIRLGASSQRRPLRLYLSPLKQDGRVTGAVAMVEDITELRRLEQVRTDFAANVSHELKTPLTSIKGFVETLMEGAVNNPPMAQKFLRIIMMEADRLTRLINDILSITKMESGEAEVSNERIRLDQMADDIVEMLSIHAAEKEITVTANQSKEPMYVWGNPDRVEQMLINLIENAIKYNQSGGSVRVSVYGTEENVQLLVSDTGIGIAEEHLPRLFERFYRVDKGRSRSMGGTGLGLAIVKHIASSMGGMIEVHSKLGEGTEFLVTLPRFHGEAPSIQTQEEDE